MGNSKLCLIRPAIQLMLTVTLLLVFQSHCAKNPERNQSMDTKFTLSFGIEIDQLYRKQLQIDQSGRCLFRLESNIGRSGNQPVGCFITQIQSEEAAQLRERVISLADEPVPSPGSIPSGVPLYEVALEENGERRSKRFDPYVVPPRFQAIGRRLLEIEAEALKTCLSGVMVAFQIQPVETLRTKPVTIDVKIVHAGSEVAKILNPALSGAAKTGRIVLTGVRADVPQEKLETIHRKALELDDSLLINREAPRMNRELALDKDKLPALEFLFKTPLDWTPGHYKVRLIVEMGRSAKDPKAFSPGRITSEPVDITLTGQSKPEDAPVVEYKPPKL
jgi:hypothetical protein